MPSASSTGLRSRRTSIAISGPLREHVAERDDDASVRTRRPLTAARRVDLGQRRRRFLTRLRTIAHHSAGMFG